MHSSNNQHVVTGAFGYTGRCIAQRLLAEHQSVTTLTHTSSDTSKDHQSNRLCVRPFSFDDPEALRRNLRGARVLYNTYWHRFSHPENGFADAVQHSRMLFTAARQAGVKRIVHISVTNPDAEGAAPYPYFRAKAQTEKALMECGVSYAILRPPLLFGRHDTLINNLAWVLRRFPVFALPGTGRYKLQPIHVDDLAQLAIRCGKLRTNQLINAIGPETYTFSRLLRTICRSLDLKRLIVPAPPTAALTAVRMLEYFLKDRIITGDETGAMMNNLLCVDAPPAGPTPLSQWIQRHADSLGIRYQPSR